MGSLISRFNSNKKKTEPVQSKINNPIPTLLPYHSDCIEQVKSRLAETEQISRSITKHRSPTKNFDTNSLKKGEDKSSPFFKLLMKIRRSPKKLTLQLGTSWPYDSDLQNFLKQNQTTKNHPLTSLFLALLNFHQSKSGVEHKLINNFELKKLEKFMNKIEKCYQKVPYHNIYHAVDVLAANEVLLNQIESSKIVKFTLQERITALLAATCHDVGHPGVTSEFIYDNQKSDCESLTTSFTDEDNKFSGMLERFHASVALENMKHFEIILSKDAEFCELFEKIIMATDMSKHTELVKSLSELVENKEEFNSSQVERLTELRQELLRITLHAADLSNPAKEFPNSHEWAVKVINEFFLQGDCEKKLNNGEVKVALNDRDKTTIKSSQIGFIDYVVKPLITPWGKLLENVEDAQCLLKCIENNKLCYQEMT